MQILSLSNWTGQAYGVVWFSFLRCNSCRSQLLNIRSWPRFARIYRTQNKSGLPVYCAMSNWHTVSQGSVLFITNDWSAKQIDRSVSHCSQREQCNWVEGLNGCQEREMTISHVRATFTEFVGVQLKQAVVWTSHGVISCSVPSGLVTSSTPLELPGWTCVWWSPSVHRALQRDCSIYIVNIRKLNKQVKNKVVRFKSLVSRVL